MSQPEKKEYNFSINGLKISITEKNEVKAENSSGEKYNVDFQDPANGHLGYTNRKFNSGLWCMSNPLTWSNVKKTGIVDVIFTGKDKRYRVRVDIINKKFTDITNDNLEIVDFVPVTKKVTVIIPAFKAADYINSCIEGFIKQEDKIGEFEMEILVGIDSCWETLKEVSKKIYPENVKFYYFKENVGPYYIRNTLATKASNDILIFFDADDIPGSTMVKMAVDGLSKSDMVRWKFFWFNSEDQVFNGNQLQVGWLTVGVFAIHKDKFFERSGFFHWRVGADTEFHERAISKNMKIKDIHQPLFFRRSLENSLTRNKVTGHKTPMRRAYNEIVDENSKRGFFPDPGELRCVPCMRV
jgi:hypothetical protein